MNCKKDELARIVAPGRPADGMIVQCVKFLGVRTFTGLNRTYESPAWLLDRPFVSHVGNLEQICPDIYLRPIRDPGDDAVDEVIQRLGTPHKETA